MKNFILILMLSSQFLFAQITVSEVSETFSQGTQKGLSIEIPEVTAEFMLDEWKDFIGKYDGKTKIEKKLGESFTDNAVIKEINANNTIDIYAKVIGKDKSQKLVVFFNLGGAYMNSSTHATQYKAAENLVIQFSRKALKSDMKNRLEAAEKLLKEYNKDKKELEQDQSKSLSNIEKYKAEIKKEEENIELNKKKQGEKDTQIGSQNKVVEDLRQKYEQMK